MRALRAMGPTVRRAVDGMWAFAIYDSPPRALSSRDRFGVKPLYRHRTRSPLLSPPRSKAILASGAYSVAHVRLGARRELPASPDDSTTGRSTFHAAISQLPAGSPSRWIRAARSESDWRFWSLDDVRELEIGRSGPSGSRRFRGRRAGLRRCGAMCRSGVSLSGGPDSSSIACAAGPPIRSARRAPEAPARVFIHGSAEYDETRYMAEIIKASGRALHRLDNDPASPLGAASGGALALRRAGALGSTRWLGRVDEASRRRGVRVVLNGQGADETLAGYPSVPQSILGGACPGRGPGLRRREVIQLFAVPRRSGPATLPV